MMNLKQIQLAGDMKSKLRLKCVFLSVFDMEKKGNMS